MALGKNLPFHLQISKKGGIVMSTQIAPTPIIAGDSAKKILKQMEIKPSPKSQEGMEILTKMFKGKEE